MKNKIISRRNFLKRGGVLFASSYIFPSLLLKRKRNTSRASINSPNILFITVDQQTFRDLGAHGNPHVNTPAINNLVRKGISFRNAYCTNPACGPSRSSWITSRMPHETGVNYNGQRPKESIPNMGEIFREKGYRTILAGKWHLPDGYPLADNKQENVRGFELLPYHPPNNRGWNRGIKSDDALSISVSNFLMNYKDNKPFLLFVSFTNPHDICYCPREPENFPMPNNKNKLPPLPSNYAINSNEPKFYKTLRQEREVLVLTKDYSTIQWKNYLHYYYQMIEKVDQAIGKVLESLEKSGLEENTLIIFTSDHGEGRASHKWTTKQSLYEEATNVPFIISWKGKIKSCKMDRYHLVSGLDVLPTMLDFAGFEVPDTMRGQSLRNIIENQEKNFRDFLVTEVAPDPQKPFLKGRMLRTSQYKYNLFSVGERDEQLFDLYYDRGETNNLAYEPTMQNIKIQLRRSLNKWMQETDDDFNK